MFFFGLATLVGPCDSLRRWFIRKASEKRANGGIEATLVERMAAPAAGN
jgi:hypothetical protein